MALTLLVVDDHPSVRRLLEVLANDDSRFGACLTAACPDSALQLAREHQPDVVVLDADLGGHDGLALIPALRAAALGVAVAVFSSAAFANPDIAERAGADMFVPKGTDLDDFLDVLADLPRAGRTHTPTVIELRDPAAAGPWRA